MKRDELVRLIWRPVAFCTDTAASAIYKHDIYVNPRTGQRQPVPRHREIETVLAKHILKYLGLK